MSNFSAAHRERLRTAKILGVMPSSDKDIRKDDKEWFDQHPERIYRFRPATSIETASFSDGRLLDGIIIKRMIGLCRIRYPVIFSELGGLTFIEKQSELNYEGDEPDKNNAVEETLSQIFQQMENIVLNIPQTVGVAND